MPQRSWILQPCRLALLWCGVAALSGCEGRVTRSVDGGASGPVKPGVPVKPGDPSKPGDPTGPTEPGCKGARCLDPALSSGPRIVRLTHAQWGNSVRDLLGLDAPPAQAAGLLADPAGDGAFDNAGGGLAVDGRLWDQYREAAEALAERATRDAQALGKVGPLGVAGQPLAQRAADWVRHVGRRAYRRPLTQSEQDELVDAFLKGPMLLKRSDRDDFAQGAEFVLRVLLQSPLFLYRAELSVAEAAPGVMPLDGYERAARLSYALWRTMPDDALLDAAAAGELDTTAGVERHARRMLGDARAREVVMDFHAQILRLGELGQLEKDAVRYPEFHPALAQAMRRELELFIGEVVLGGGKVADLYLSRRAHVNRELAALYGLSGDFDDSFRAVELPADQRAGLLTRAGFLAIKATPYDKNSIHRGVFINHHVVCSPLPPIPDNVVLPESRGDTNRERVESLTKDCGGACHNLYINPAGFALERYDGLGRYQTMEGAHPIDASGGFLFRSGLERFVDGVDFSRKVAQLPDAHDCYTRHWFEYLYGRLPGAGDEPLIAQLAARSHEDGLAIRELLVALVSHELFLNRAAD
jgi:hypothetical protein